MCRITFAAVAAAAALSPLKAQQVPGRDLFLFPLGSLAEAPALATAAGGGFWNPATIALGKADRYRFAADALQSPIEQGVTAQIGTVAMRLRSSITAGISVAQSSVGDLIRTDTDPQSDPVSPEIPYRSTIYSGIVAAERAGTTIGLAVRSRTGRIDVSQGAATSVDIGATLDRPRDLPFRIAAASFLFAPTARKRERASSVAAIEAYLPQSGERDLRAGFSLQRDEGAGNERYLYASGRTGLLEIRGGLVRQQAYGSLTSRLRLGVGLRHAQYIVGIAREDGTSGLGASYQFLLSTVMPMVVPR